MKEFDIRPQELFDRFLRIVEEDNKTFFRDRSRFRELACPACRSKKIDTAFQKNGFRYSQCIKCGCLYLNPRPPAALYRRYYQNSKTSRFWAEKFYPAVEDKRRRNLYRPKARRVQKLLARVGSLVDIGSGYGTFLEELQRTGTAKKYYGIEPSTHLAECSRKKGFDIFETTVETYARHPKIKFDAAVSLELFEHVVNPFKFMSSVNAILKKNGTLILTTLQADGFDIKLLGPYSKSISPPIHINFFTERSFQHLWRRTGFEIQKVFTPGVLDVDIVRNTSLQYHLSHDPFIEQIIFDETLSKSFQRFLSNHRLSSHIWIVAKKIREISL